MAHIETFEAYAEFTDFPVSDIGIQYPNTQENKKLRQMYFGDEPVDHPSKNELSLILDLFKYVSKPGDTVLDPMAGTGSLMLAAIGGRRVILMEMEEELHKLQLRNLEYLQEFYNVDPTLVTLLQGDCRDLLIPDMADHLITSPPYGRTQANV